MPKQKKQEIVQPKRISGWKIPKDFFENLNTIAEGYWAQAAGMADGDGCFTLRYNGPGAKLKVGYDLSLTDREPVQWLADVYGTSISEVTYKDNWENSFKTTLYGDRVMHFMLKVCPYLVEKRDLVTRFINKTFPDYHPRKIPMNVNNISVHMGYIAGFFDAEGSVGCKPYAKKGNDTMRSWLTFTNTNIRPLKKMKKFLTSMPFSWTEKDITIDSYREKTQRKKNGKEKKIRYNLRINTRAQITFMAIFQPIIQIKRKAEKALKLKLLRQIDIMTGHNKWATPLHSKLDPKLGPQQIKYHPSLLDNGGPLYFLRGEDAEE
tara:strand:- start:1281 stop:2243 length:963 start_codon:yes stop_codon:yes gene_type:complete